MNNQKLNFEEFCQMYRDFLSRQENMRREQSRIQRNMMMLWNRASVTFWKEHVPQCHIEKIL